MTIHKVLYSSRSEEWPTPQSFFNSLDKEFRFTLDPCATRSNAKCARFFTRTDDGLNQNWGRHRVFCNPPYGKSIRDWTRKCYECPPGMELWWSCSRMRARTPAGSMTGCTARRQKSALSGAA